MRGGSFNKILQEQAVLREFSAAVERDGFGLGETLAGRILRANPDLNAAFRHAFVNSPGSSPLKKCLGDFEVQA